MISASCVISASCTSDLGEWYTRAHAPLHKVIARSAARTVRWARAEHVDPVAAGGEGLEKAAALERQPEDLLAGAG